MIYSGENNGLLVESYPVNNPDVWVQGDMSKPDEATNTDLIRAGKLYHYNRSVAIYHCPTDPGKTTNGAIDPDGAQLLDELLHGRPRSQCGGHSR